MKAWPLLFLIACHPDSNCGIEGETPERGAVFQEAVFQIETPQTDLVVEWVPALPHWGSFSELVLLEAPWAQAPADSEQVHLSLDTPPTLLAEDHDARAIFFVPMLFQDHNLDGLHSPDEPYLSVSSQVIAYFEAVGCAEWSEVAHLGWNGLDLRGDQPIPWDLNAFYLGDELRAVESLQLTVALESVALDATDGLRVALAPERIWLDDFWVSALIDQPAQTTLNLNLPFSPPENHLQASDIAGDRFRDWQYAVELPLLYTDANESGNLDANDPLSQALCVESPTGDHRLAARIGHAPEPDTAEEAFYMKTNPVQAGWGLYVETQSNTWGPMDPETNPLIPGDCPLPSF